jgi:hypothetical protein
MSALRCPDDQLIGISQFPVSPSPIVQLACVLTRPAAGDADHMYCAADPITKTSAPLYMLWCLGGGGGNSSPHLSFLPILPSTMSLTLQKRKQLLESLTSIIHILWSDQ